MYIFGVLRQGCLPLHDVAHVGDVVAGVGGTLLHQVAVDDDERAATMLRSQGGQEPVRTAAGQARGADSGAPPLGLFTGDSRQTARGRDASE